VQPRDVHVPRFQDRPSCKDRVTVGPSPMMSRAAESRLHTQGGGERFNLSFSSLTEREDFLERDDVGVQIGQNVRDPFDRCPAIDSTAFVNVVGHDPHNGNFTAGS
jgi:hypothetical protein